MFSCLVSSRHLYQTLSRLQWIRYLDDNSRHMYGIRIRIAKLVQFQMQQQSKAEHRQLASARCRHPCKANPFCKRHFAPVLLAGEGVQRKRPLGISSASTSTLIIQCTAGICTLLIRPSQWTDKRLIDACARTKSQRGPVQSNALAFFFFSRLTARGI